MIGTKNPLLVYASGYDEDELKYDEHYKKCSECEGTGLVDVIDQRRINCRTIDIPYKTVRCEECDGTGIIEIEL